MTKRISFAKLSLIIICLILVTASSVSATFAKYTSTTVGSDVARVASWDIKAGSSNSDALNIAGNNPPFKLFDTVYDTVQQGSTPEADSDVMEERIAPGTRGAFELYVRNDSEVTAEYTIQFTLDNPGNVPLLFSFDKDLADSEWFDSIDELNNAVTETSVSVLKNVPLEMTAEDTVTVYWKWLYEQSDVEAGDLADTINGINAPEVKITATLVASQVN